VSAQAGGVVEVGVVEGVVDGVVEVGVGEVGVEVVVVGVVVGVVEAVVVVDGVVVAVDAADGSVVVIGVLVLVLDEPEFECLTLDVAAVAAPVTLSLRTGAASLACWAVCCTLGLLFTRVAAWRSCSYRWRPARAPST
jgi:hypothetical protein